MSSKHSKKGKNSYTGVTGKLKNSKIKGELKSSQRKRQFTFKGITDGN